jgi:hypothetical protein
VLIARGRLPLEVVDVMLQVPYRITMPLAPANGLCLYNSGFGVNGGRVSFLRCWLLDTVVVRILTVFVLLFVLFSWLVHRFGV